ncbi:alpha/beta hydrolase [Micromonospora rifamycinica]|uniref:alpha/beta hydrolase n=1 Tax=Micromonospora rifamycinica TaxID=291594 RepID=UPI003446C2BB
MNDLAELKQFASVHAKAQGITGYLPIVDLIDSDDGDRPGSWVRQWSSRADELRARGRQLAAAQHYNMARFPYVDGEPRQRALENCVAAFGSWAAGHGIERFELDLPGGVAACWATGLSARDPRPLVLMCGGIVSIKEQWAEALVAMRRVGVAGLVCELPGVGENTTRYDEHSWRTVSVLLDAVAGRADVARTCALMFSFGGHLALRCAQEDSRVCGIVTAGAPVHAFFTDERWQRGLPRVTADTLARLTGTAPDALAGALRPMALDPARLAELEVPVAYISSTRDEIIPLQDVELLRARVRRLGLLERDDVHGAPGHVVDNRLWSMLAALRMLDHPTRRARLLVSAIRLLRLGRKVRRTPATGRYPEHDRWEMS